MFSSQIDQLRTTRTKSDALITALESHLKFLNKLRDVDGGRFSTAGGVEGASYNLVECVLFAQRALKSFKAVKLDKNTPITSGVWEATVQAIVELEAASTQFDSPIQALSNHVPAIRISVGANVATADGSQMLASFGNAARSLVSAAEKLISNVAMLNSFSRSSEAAKNGQDADLILDDAKSSAEALQSIEVASTKVVAMGAEAQNIKDNISAILDKLNSTIADGQAKIDRQMEILSQGVGKISELSTQSTADAAVATSKFEDLTRLAAQGETLHAKLSAFAADLTDTQVSVASLQTQTEKMVAQFSDQSDEVKQLISEAEAMVSGATSAGLAKAFSDERDALDKAMKGSFWGFCIGIALLSVSTVVLAAYVLQIPITLWGVHISGPKPGSTGYEITLAGVISRGIILLAPFWLTLFSARRYRSLFDLRQQYSHKYNMAFSVDGFKRQAPKYAEDITAWVFSIVATNPVLQSSGSPMDNPPATTVKEMIDGAAEQFSKVLKPSG